MQCTTHTGIVMNTKTASSVAAVPERPYAAVLAQWPDLAALARDLSLPYETVVSWSRRDSVPEPHWESISEAARLRGIRGVTYARFRSIAAERRAGKTSSCDPVHIASTLESRRKRGRDNIPEPAQNAQSVGISKNSIISRKHPPCR